MRQRTHRHGVPNLAGTATTEARSCVVADELVKQAVGGVAVGLVIDGELVWSKGYGVVDVDTKAVPDADTRVVSPDRIP